MKVTSHRPSPTWDWDVLVLRVAARNSNDRWRFTPPQTSTVSVLDHHCQSRLAAPRAAGHGHPPRRARARCFRAKTRVLPTAQATGGARPPASSSLLRPPGSPARALLAVSAARAREDRASADAATERFSGTGPLLPPRWPLLCRCGLRARAIKPKD